MNNFEYYNPVHVLFGKNQIASLPKVIPNGSKVLITYGGGSIKKNGVYEQVQNALKEYQLFELGGIEANPQYDTLMKAVDLAKKENVDYLLAVGGGSVVDGTKFISAAIHHDTDPWNMLAKREPIKDVTPMGAILTLPATGSEMNSFAVVSRGQDKLGFGGDPRMYPKFSILDPEVTFSLPEKQLGNGIVDAFVHVLEQYLTKDINTPLQDTFAEGILTTLINEAPKVMEMKSDYESRANFMWAATNALNGMIGSGVVHDWATHMIGHELTALHGIDHARTLALVLPSLLRDQKENKKTKILKYAKNVWKLDTSNEESAIEDAIKKTEDFFNSVGVPTKLSAYEITEDHIADIVSSVAKHHPYNLGENQNIDSKKIKSILAEAL